MDPLHTPSRSLPNTRFGVFARDVNDINAQIGRSLRAGARQTASSCRDILATAAGVSRPPKPAGAEPTRGFASAITTMQAAWQIEEYRRQFLARMGTQVANGVYYGTSILLLNLYAGGMRGTGSQLADSSIRMAELICSQFGSMWRADVEVDSRSQNTVRAGRPSPARSASTLLYAWVGEVALVGCFLGASLCRRAAWLTSRRLVVALGVLRVLRTLLTQVQHAHFDKLKALAGPTGQDAERRPGEYWAKTRWVEQSGGMLVNALTSLSMQYLPVFVPAASMLGLIVGLVAGSILLSLLTKLPLREYLDKDLLASGTPAAAEPDGAGVQSLALAP